MLCSRTTINPQDLLIGMGKSGGHEYSWNLAKSSLQDLEKYGKSYVSKHSDRMGDGFSFGPDLVIIR
jgi:hypothetical protein